MKRCALIFVLGLMMVSLLQAAPPSGTFHIELDPEVNKVRDFTGSYTYSFPVFGGSATFNYDLVHEVNGRLSGNGTFFLDIFDGEGDGTYNLKGSFRYSERDELNLFLLQFRDMIGSGAFETEEGIQEKQIIGAALVQAKFRSNTNRVIGTTAGRFEIKKHGILDIDVGYSVPVPVQSGGVVIDMTVVPDRNKFTGTAIVTLSNGRVINYNVTGIYDSRRDLSRINLRPVNKADRKSVISIDTFGDAMVIYKLEGKILGQTILIDPPREFPEP